MLSWMDLKFKAVKTFGQWEGDHQQKPGFQILCSWRFLIYCALYKHFSSLSGCNWKRLTEKYNSGVIWSSESTSNLGVKLKMWAGCEPGAGDEMTYVCTERVCSAGKIFGLVL